MSAWLRACKCVSMFVRMFFFVHYARVYVFVCANVCVWVCAAVRGRARVPPCACMRRCVNACYASLSNINHSQINL